MTGINHMSLVVIWITIRAWRRFAVSEFLECDERLCIFGVKEASLDAYLNAYGDFLSLLKFAD